VAARREKELVDETHIPVLVDETLRYLEPERGGVYVDLTVGLGGHAEALLERAPEARLVGIDQDRQALALAAERLERFGDRVELVEANFADCVPALSQRGLGEGSVAGILADLGVSSLQLDRPERGFAFRFDGPLDMRMGSGGRSAREIVNEASEADLVRIFKEYGEERQARRIARAIVHDRVETPFETTADLKGLIDRVKHRPRPGSREGRVDPATRVFQALRIETNQELVRLEEMLDEVVRLLDDDGRLVVISYHSLEDRIVKNTLRDLARGEIDQVTGRPKAETRVIEVLTKKPVRPTDAEVEANPRARSGRLRAARRREPWEPS
jgi:16S rRNA (cytosine1402-N4)-methyltransferase